jgi:hypothetical protein
MTLAIWSFPERPLTVLGDAIASFLEKPDEHTAGQCLIRHPGHTWVTPQRRRRSSLLFTWTGEKLSWNRAANMNYGFAIIL